MSSLYTSGWYKPLKQEIECVTFYSVTILTFCAFTYVTHSLCPKRRDIPKLVRALHDKGVISDILSIPGKPFATWEILIGHRWLVQPPPTALAILAPNVPSISKKSGLRILKLRIVALKKSVFVGLKLFWYIYIYNHFDFTHGSLSLGMFVRSRPLPRGLPLPDAFLFFHIPSWHSSRI